MKHGQCQKTGHWAKGMQLSSSWLSFLPLIFGQIVQMKHQINEVGALVPTRIIALPLMRSATSATKWDIFQMVCVDRCLFMAV